MYELYLDLSTSFLFGLRNKYPNHKHAKPKKELHWKVQVVRTELRRLSMDCKPAVAALCDGTHWNSGGLSAT